MSKPIIEVCNLSKQYHIGLKEKANRTFREALVDTVAAPARNFKRLRQVNKIEESETPDTIWALHDVSFEVQPGEVVGIIGRNGAGKSTLLKILSRITEPTSGEVRMRGRVASLLEVGTGFHPELTGRENIYLNGTILGMRQAEIDRKFDEIVAFSEIEKFLDTPVKRYSSGMYVRLAFAVAAHLEPEILLVDEVLAVGDAAFQRKCLGKMSDIAKEGRTVLFVSHNMDAIRKLCPSAILLKNGTISQKGSTDSVIDDYLTSYSINNSPIIKLPQGNPSAPGEATRCIISNTNGVPQTAFKLREEWNVTIELSIKRPTEHVIAGLGLVTITGIPVATFWSEPKNLDAGTYSISFHIQLPLKATTIQFCIGISSNEASFYYVDNIGSISITEVAAGKQPFKTSGAGILLTSQESPITPINI